MGKDEGGRGGGKGVKMEVGGERKTEKVRKKPAQTELRRGR